MIFAREVSDPLTSLVKQVDTAAGELSGQNTDVFVIFCSDDAKLEAKLKDLVEKGGIVNSAVSMTKPAGPPGFKVPNDADATVVIFSNRVAQAAFTYKKEDLTPREVARVLDAMDVGPAAPFPVGYVAPAYVPRRAITSKGYGADKSALGPNPNVLIFARETNVQLTTLTRRVDEIARDKSADLDSFVILIGDAKEHEGKLKELAETNRLGNTTLSVEPWSNVRPFRVPKKSDVTILVCDNGGSKAVYSMKWQELNEKTCDRIVADVNKIVQARKPKGK
jgi:hypothetical protein